SIVSVDGSVYAVDVAAIDRGKLLRQVQTVYDDLILVSFLTSLDDASAAQVAFFLHETEG
ncbi:MAG: hypothetical protein ACK55Z_17575, partial [bacterium]